MCLISVNVYHRVSSPMIIFAESGFVTRVRLLAWRLLTNERPALGPGDQWEASVMMTVVARIRAVQAGGWAGGGLWAVPASLRAGLCQACGSVLASESRRSGVTQWETESGTLLSRYQWVQSTPSESCYDVTLRDERDVMTLWHNRMRDLLCIVVLWSLITHAPSLFSPWYLQRYKIQITRLSIL